MAEISTTYNCIVVDDNEIDRLTTQAYIKPHNFLRTVASYDSAAEALENLNKDNPDVFFLDIDMDDMSGLELRREMGNEKPCIFITSYPEYAVESFELDALDFIVKPINKERFNTSMERLKQYLLLKQKANLFESSLGADSIFIKDGTEQIKIQLHDVLYLEALKDYTSIVTSKRKYSVLHNLGNLLQEAAFKTFVRIHRSYAVQKNYISKITAQQVFLNDLVLPVGRSYKDNLNFLS